MAAQSLALSNVINVSVATPQTGLNAYNTSNLALFTRESSTSSFGTAPYKIYLSPNQVALDFGTSSNTYAMANAVFSQQPNILSPGGYLVVIPYLAAAQDQIAKISFPGTPASGTWEISYNSNATAALAYNITAAALQTALRLVTGLSTATATGSIAAGFVIDPGTTGIGYPFSIVSNSLVDANSVAITPVVTVVQAGSAAETLDAAIVRTSPLIQYFGVMQAEVASSSIVLLAAAAAIQARNMIGFHVSYTAADVASGGMLDLLRTGTLTQNRGLFYDDVLATALVYMASYASLGLSVNFNGSNTTNTMHLKSLVGVQPDPNITQTILNSCQLAGADTYVSIQGVPKVICSGANDFFDNQYNLQWLAGAIQVAAFNALAQVNTKVPQTEGGMNILKTAIRAVMEQAVTNQFLAPGSWNSTTFFGIQADLILNVSQRGYYIYSVPVAQQLASVRTTRAAPLIQIAAKYAGAIHSASVVVNINA